MRLFSRKWKELLNILKNDFLKQIFHCPSKNFLSHIEIMIFYQNLWSPLIWIRTVKLKPKWILQSGYEELMQQLKRYLVAKNKN
jgi:hypothetical protein